MECEFILKYPTSAAILHVRRDEDKRLQLREPRRISIDARDRHEDLIKGENWQKQVCKGSCRLMSDL